MAERVVPDSHTPGAWVVRVGGADQFWGDPDDPTRLEFDYVQRLADQIDHHAPPAERLRAVHVGGAAMTLAHGGGTHPAHQSADRAGA